MVFDLSYSQKSNNMRQMAKDHVLFVYYCYFSQIFYSYVCVLYVCVCVCVSCGHSSHYTLIDTGI